MNPAEILFWSAAGLLAYLLAGYPLLIFFVGFFVRARDRFVQESLLPFVTVIVPAHNEEAVIEGRIKNLLEEDQEYPSDRLEVIVVSDGSTDRTDQIVRSFEGGGRVRLLRQERAGKTAGLNRAVKSAKGEILLLTDANTRFEAGTVKSLVRPLADPRVGCACGDLRLLSSSVATAGEGGYWSYETLLKRGESRLGWMLMGAGGIYALRRSDWIEVPSEMADDSLIPLSLRVRGLRVVFFPSARAVESISQTVGEELRRRVRMVAQDARLIFYFKGFLSPFRPVLLFQFLSHKWLRWQLGHLMMILLAANVGLVFSAEGSGGQVCFYFELLLLQLMFYGAALLGGVVDLTGQGGVKLFKLLMMPYYFVSANAASTLGFWRGTLGRSQAIWAKAESTRQGD